MKIKLNSVQKNHYESIKWLLDSDKNVGNGRSFLMAVTFLKIAIENPGKEVQVFDHVGYIPVTRSREMILSMINEIIQKDDSLKNRVQIIHSRGALKVDQIKYIEFDIEEVEYYHERTHSALPSKFQVIK